jgi:hypothetical protein
LPEQALGRRANRDGSALSVEQYEARPVYRRRHRQPMQQERAPKAVAHDLDGGGNQPRVGCGEVAVARPAVDRAGAPGNAADAEHSSQLPRDAERLQDVAEPGARGQSDGTWKLVIDNPGGAA